MKTFHNAASSRRFPQTDMLPFVKRCEVGTTHWVQCNDTPVKFARFPVTGLVEGRSYTFRVRAVNKSGISHPSRVSEPVAAMDPADRARMRGPGLIFGYIVLFISIMSTKMK